MKILIVQESDWIKRGPHQQHQLADRLFLRGHQIRVIDYEILWPPNSPQTGVIKGPTEAEIVIEPPPWYTNVGTIVVPMLLLVVLMYLYRKKLF